MAEKKSIQTCVVYGLRQRGVFEYFYVGSTKKTVGERLKEHFDGLKWNKNRHFTRKILKIGTEQIVADTLEMVSPEDRFHREFAWIGDLLACGVKLTNVVVDASTYPRCQARDEHEERITDPAFLLAGFLEAVQGRPAADPRHQKLLEGLDRVTKVIFRSILDDLPDFFCPLITREQARALAEASV